MMQFSIRFLFLFISLGCMLRNCATSSNEHLTKLSNSKDKETTANFDCLDEKSLQIKKENVIYKSSEVINIFYKLELAVEGTLDEFIRKCVKNIAFKYILSDTSNVNENIITKAITPEQSVNQSSFVEEFSDLKPVTKYYFSIGYTPKGTNIPIYVGEIFIVETCFGVPGEIQGIKTTEQSNKDVKIEWKPPVLFNSANISYYHVTIRTLTSSIPPKDIVEKVTEPVYTLSAEKRKNRLAVKIAAVNDASYFGSQFDRCEDKTLMSKEIILSYDAVVLEPTTTKPPNQASNLKKIPTTLFFSIFLAISLTLF
jgi:hypothetical protein